MSRATIWLDQKLYPGFEDNWDDKIFRETVLEFLKPDMEILDLGAGAGIVGQMDFRGKADRVCGVDLDPRVEHNPFLDEGRVSDAGEIPYPDGSFDLVYSDNVLEHLEHPAKVFNEVSRVLKPGGLFMFKTPNKWHYMPTIARLSPHSFHQFVNRMRGRAVVDTFPTLYRANTKGDVSLLAKQAGFQVLEIKRIEGRPEYLRMSTPTYLLGMLYERIVNRTEMLAPFRVVLIGVFRKS